MFAMLSDPQLLWLCDHLSIPHFLRRFKDKTSLSKTGMLEWCIDLKLSCYAHCWTGSERWTMLMAQSRTM